MILVLHNLCVILLISCGLVAKKMKIKLVFVAGLIAGMIFLALVLRFYNGVAESSSLQEPVPTYIAPTQALAEEQMIAEYERMLQDETLDHQLRQSIEEKLTMAQRMLEERLGTGPAISAPQSIQPPPVQTDPPFEPGIFAGDEGRFHPVEAVIQNYWQDLVNSNYVQVFAGATGGDPQQGVIYRVVTSADKGDTRVDRYLTPEKHGTILVESETDWVLTLITSDGTRYEFDVNTAEIHLKQ